MALSTLRDPTVILTDYTNFTSWMLQLRTRCDPLKIWELVDPEDNRKLRTKPLAPEPPEVGQYQPNANLASQSNDDEPMVPMKPSDLSAAGQKAYKEDVEYFKIQLEAYKIRDREYREEKANLEKVVLYIQATVSQHLQRNCCKPGESIRQWITSLMETVGVDKEDERDRARARYLQALKPMRQPSNWDTWLSEYDHAATEAETNNVAEIQSFHDVKKDFLVAIMKAAPTWGISFQEHRSRDVDINRKEMMKRFREHMALLHPIKGKPQRGAFAAAGPSLAAGGASTPGTDRDASHAAEDAPSIHEQQTWTTNNQRGRGRPRQKRSFGQSATSKQSSIDDTAAVGGLKCPACEMRHSLKDCFYAFPEHTPEWFNPRPGFTAMVNYRIQNDSHLQEEMRKVKRLRSQIPRTKLSYTQTSGINNE